MFTQTYLELNVVLKQHLVLIGLGTKSVGGTVNKNSANTPFNNVTIAINIRKLPNLSAKTPANGGPKISATGIDVTDDSELGLVREEEIDDRVLNSFFDESNRSVLLMAGAALLLLLAFVTMRRKRIQGEIRGAPQTSGVIETTLPTTGFADDSDVASKLDLARAYVEMGDNETARELLSEVNVHGNADQKVEAKRLIDTLGS